MAEKLKGFKFRVGRFNEYPREWMDGNAYRLVRGRDFTVPVNRGGRRMTRRDFELIARIVASAPGFDGDEEHCSDELGRRELAEHFAALLAATNARFDRARFVRACLKGR